MVHRLSHETAISVMNKNLVRGGEGLLSPDFFDTGNKIAAPAY
jgi:hypothetical protein